MNLAPLEQLSYESLVRLVKTRFRVWVDPQESLELELSEITPRRVAAAGTNARAYENFALVFLGPAERLLPQRIYVFESAPIGRFELFIVPVSCDPSGARYQATFNRQVKPG